MNANGNESGSSLSPINYFQDVQANINLPARILLHDVTLRDGEQTPGVVFEPEERVRVARVLNDLGVHRIEAGFPVVSEGDREGVAAVAAADLDAEVWGFGRCLPVLATLLVHT
jgi:methanogen homocitrate synthase